MCELFVALTFTDSQPPVIERCHSPGVVLSSDQDTHVAWEEPQFSDNSGRPVTVSRSHNPGLSMSWGTTRVEYVASDSTGNTKSCHITVNVQREWIVNWGVLFLFRDLCDSSQSLTTFHSQTRGRLRTVTKL